MKSGEQESKRAKQEANATDRSREHQTLNSAAYETSVYIQSQKYENIKNRVSEITASIKKHDI